MHGLQNTSIKKVLKKYLQTFLICYNKIKQLIIAFQMKGEQKHETKQINQPIRVESRTLN